MWSRFERTIQGDRTLQFEIEDIPESMWSTAVEFMLGNYIREDVWWSTAGDSVFINHTHFLFKICSREGNL